MKYIGKGGKGADEERVIEYMLIRKQSTFCRVQSFKKMCNDADKGENVMGTDGYN